MFTWIFAPFKKNSVLKGHFKTLGLINVYPTTYLSLSFPEANRPRSPHWLPFLTIPRHSQCELLDLDSWIPGGKEKVGKSTQMIGISSRQPWNFQRGEIRSICYWMHPSQNPKYPRDASCNVDSEWGRWGVESGKNKARDFFMSRELEGEREVTSPGRLLQRQQSQLLCCSAHC